MANLDPRTYRLDIPLVGNVVMIQVDKVVKGVASVSLLEYKDKKYNNLKGIIEESKYVRHRIEPALVVSTGPLVLSRSLLHPRDRFFAEQRFNKFKYVESIMCAVSRMKEIPVPDLHSLIGLHSYDKLIDFDSELWKGYGKYVHPAVKALRSCLTDLICRTWRIIDPSILQSTTIKQKYSTCWAHALIRQFEALLKLQGKMEKDEYLRVEDLIGLVERGRSGIKCYYQAFDALTVHGITSNLGKRYKLSSMEVIYDDDYSREEWNSLIEEKAMQGIPTAVTVVWYSSYNRYPSGEHIIYEATEDESGAFNLKPYSRLWPTHSMLLTGGGVDEMYRIPYLECQDSNGDVGNGDRGYLRFARCSPCPIFEFVVMTL